MGASRSGHEAHEMPLLKLVVTLCPLISLAPETALSCPQSLLATMQYHIFISSCGIKNIDGNFHWKLFLRRRFLPNLFLP